MKATCIIWDTDGDMELRKQLPKEIELPKEIAIDENGNINYDGIDDYLSYVTGVCHEGYVVEDLDVREATEETQKTLKKKSKSNYDERC